MQNNLPLQLSTETDIQERRNTVAAKMVCSSHMQLMHTTHVNIWTAYMYTQSTTNTQ